MYKFKRFLKRLLIFTIILAVLCIIFDLFMASITNKASLYHAKLLAYNSINGSLSETVADMNIDYDDIAFVTYGNDNEVKSVEMNTVYINKIKSKLVLDVNNYISKYEITKIGIPVGTFTGNDYLSGMGPKVEVEVQFGGCSVTDIKSEFYTAGINQTCHRINVVVSVEVYVYSFGKRYIDSVECECSIAETVIVGSVPETYIDINKNNSEK